jgi:lipopolysaccharide/colanic/teichoic acid biosynthesis glycosyltransferase/GGDEF domain-containing protein
LKEAGAGNIKLVKSGTTRADVLDGVQGLYNEDYFNRMLSLERKRSQRSKKPFLLMLFDITKLVNPHPNLVVISQVGHILEAGIRETDVRGWYRRGHIVGVIFTELESACESVRDKIFGKVLTSLAREIGPEDLQKIEISFHVFPEDHDKGNGTGRFNMNLYKDLLEGERRKGVSRKMKRLMDIVGSLLALVIFSPLFLVITIAIKLTSEGPVLFRQTRIGQWGKTFTFLKFRSMQVKQAANPHKEYIEKLICKNECAANGNGTRKEAPVFKLTDDPRITAVGRFIRKTSLDELPQFINVLRGEMSLVGPRPPVPYEADIYDVWHRMRLLSVKPGITGLWQVVGRSTANFDEMVRLDLKYVTDWSLWQDIKIMLKTPWVVIMGKGAY